MCNEGVRGNYLGGLFRVETKSEKRELMLRNCNQCLKLCWYNKIKWRCISPLNWFLL